MSAKLECRFCLEEDTKTNLISPCRCKGSFKFVHNECLLKWYQHEPSKALNCSVCLCAFAKTIIHPVEDLDILKPYLCLFLNKPFLYVCICNLVYCMIYTNLKNQGPIDFTSSYIIYQCMLHMVFFIFYGILLHRVNNKFLYLSMWKERNRFILLPIHMVTVFGITKTTWIGGISSNICLIMYLFEHFDILTKLNQRHNFIFISRGRGRPPTRSSLLEAS